MGLLPVLSNRRLFHQASKASASKDAQMNASERKSSSGAMALAPPA